MKPLLGRRGKLEVYEAELNDYTNVSQLLVDAFYSGDDAEGLKPMQRRGLERDQSLDLRARYGRKGSSPQIRSTILVCAETEEGRDLGCVALGTTPFVGDEAQLSIRDLYAYANRAGSKGQEEACLRPVVANLVSSPLFRLASVRPTISHTHSH